MKSERIKALRAKLGMSPVEFAAAIQTSVASIYRWEKKTKVDPVHRSIMEAIELALKENPGPDQQRIIIHNLRVGLRDLVYLALTNKPRTS